MVLQAAPAVVNIVVQTNGFPYSGAHSGSGFIVDADGTILVSLCLNLPTLEIHVYTHSHT